MRMLPLEIGNKWEKVRFHLSRPKLGLDVTNNSLERGIGNSKVRYSSMRGYKSPEGIPNAIALTQWLYDKAKDHDLAEDTYYEARQRARLGLSTHITMSSNYRSSSQIHRHLL
jgi:hypothetical protein